MNLVSSACVLLSLGNAAFPAVAFYIGSPRPSSVRPTSLSLSSSENYLSLLSDHAKRFDAPKSNGHSKPAVASSPFAPAIAEDTLDSEEPRPSFSHAPIHYFAIDKLSPKGPRANADLGTPHDATRQLVEFGPTSVGSWWCAAGGWPSPKQRATTEIFMVFAGRGRLTDLDGTPHEFGPGDVVILPKGWSGRWDVLQPIHKVWFVHDHPNIEETSDPIRAVITTYRDLVAPSSYHCQLQGSSRDVNPQTIIYDIGPTQVGCRTCTPGSYPILVGDSTECFHVLEGIFFITNPDGSAQRCVPGDTLALPKGWAGHMDVVETVKKLSVSVA